MFLLIMTALLGNIKEKLFVIIILAYTSRTLQFWGNISHQDILNTKTVVTKQNIHQHTRISTQKEQ